MSQKILALDLGTSSIGTALRNPDLGEELQDQLEYFSSDIFKSGVGKDKTGEYSFAAERTKHRQSRKLHATRRFRLWTTLHLLIENNLCPLSLDSLQRWSTYDKSRNLFRQYPINDNEFESWIRLDFDGDGTADYSSPYQLRRELVTRQFDFAKQLERYKLGRALYHIAQRRGFKSSKGETLVLQEKEQEFDNAISDIDKVDEMKKSETKLSKGIAAYCDEHGLKTVGEAFASLEDNGERIINNSKYKAVRSQYEDEIKEIFKFQNGLDINSDLFRHLLSKKKGEGTIFYKKPLKSQRGLIGKCTLEPNKSRCPIGHPEYEKFRAWSFINNISYRNTDNGDWTELPLNLKESLYKQLFTSRVKPSFSFNEIIDFINKSLNLKLIGDGENRTINYKSSQSVSGCPVIARMINMLGENWQDYHFEGNKHRTTHGSKNLKQHTVNYDAYDLWHVCFDSDELDDVMEFADKSLGWDEDNTKKLVRLWSSISQGYAMLSLKAIKNINRMLCKGLKYSDAVMLAKIPDIVDIPDEEINEIIDDYRNTIKKDVNVRKVNIGIVNSLIADYKTSVYTLRFADHNYSYKLDESDHKEIISHIIDYVGIRTWELMDANEQESIIKDVTDKYQQFFKDRNRKYYTSDRLDGALKEYLGKRYPNINTEKWNKLYHPSQISIYHINNTDKSEIRLGSPNIGSMRNPVALRTLNMLRHKINRMLDADMISPEETRIVVETTREMNDANMRWAIEHYQNEREKENKEIKEILQKEYPSREINENDVDAGRYVIEQTGNDTFLSDKFRKYSFDSSKLKKYRLWLEQGCQCLYTGRIINLSNLFGKDAPFDVEHTIPRSISFDCSDENLTICDSHYNRAIKKNHIPTELPNYDKDVTIDGIEYTAIKPRLKSWEDKVERLSNNVEFWRAKSKYAQSKDFKDDCIRQRHLWQMELNHWRSKLERFKMMDVTQGFRNSQLVDTGIITKYATLYLKSVFEHVDVQKGAVTADFRKMLGIQDFDETKKREKHSHHAIDAAVLTTIPVSAKRDRMLKLFYEIIEDKRMGHDVSNKKDLLSREIEDCNIGHNASSIVEFIDNNILINHHTKDRTFFPARREISILDKSGKKVKKIATGDSVRGRLHEETFLGAIKFPKEDGPIMERKPIMRDGHFDYPEDGKDIVMVKRIPLDSNNFKEIKDLEKIIDANLRIIILSAIDKRIKDGLSFKEAIEQGVWMIDKYGNEIHKDKNGRLLCPIRHVRCKVKAGRGYLTFDKSLKIKKQMYSSPKRLVNIPNRNHKGIVYAINDGNYLCLLYEGIKKGAIDRKCRFVNTFEAAELMRSGSYVDLEKDLWKEPYYSSLTDKKIIYKLSAILKVGTRVILWDKNPSEIYDLSKTELSKRLFIILNFNTASSDRIYLRNHLDAKTEGDNEKISLVPSQFNCLIEHRDFEIDELGRITFQNSI